MSNRTRIDKTRASRIACEWFAQYLYARIDGRMISKGFRNPLKVATDLGISEKTLRRYKLGVAVPDLEVVAEILAYFGEDEIRIPLKEIR